jgi:anti-anti-sigma factor
MPGVELSSGAWDGHVAEALRGELDMTGAADVEAAVTALVARCRYLVIDLSALDFIDCSSLRALRLLTLTGHDEVFWVQASVAAAVAGLASCPTEIA